MKRIFHDLKAELYTLGIKQLDVANKAGVAYSTLSSQLNGFNPMSNHVHKTIIQMIAAAKREAAEKQLKDEYHSDNQSKPRFLGV